MRILITGGAGFIGSAVVRFLAGLPEVSVINVDKMTYAGSVEALARLDRRANYVWEDVDICEPAALDAVFREHQPDMVMNLAAETHVDRSISDSAAFIRTNVQGTHALLEVSLRHWQAMDSRRRNAFRFLQVSTDEVYGALGSTGAFTESTPYAPNSPYSASKAGADHLVRAWLRTYGLPVLITNSSNNYGPWQHPEKLIPQSIIRGFRGLPIPIYGGGENIRDWLFVEDHAEALVVVLMRGRVGETYNIGGGVEKRNLDVVSEICGLLDQMVPEVYSRSELIEFVPDRPGHDFRYALSTEKVRRELGWQPRTGFTEGMRKTVDWYLRNQGWWRLRDRACGDHEDLPLTNADAREWGMP